MQGGLLEKYAQSYNYGNVSLFYLYSLPLCLCHLSLTLSLSLSFSPQLMTHVSHPSHPGWCSTKLKALQLSLEPSVTQPHASSLSLV